MLPVGPGSNPSFLLRAAVSIFLLVIIPLLACAQGPVPPSDENLVSKFLDQQPLGSEHLKCEIKQQHPFLDFEFRFDVSYIVRCPVKEFGGKQSTLFTFIRITPEGGQRKLFGEAFGLPEIPESMRAHTDISKLKSEFDFSGGFAAGEGRYAVDVLVGDKQSGRMCRKSWKVALARKHGEEKIPLTIGETVVVPMGFHHWEKKADPNGLRVTVLLDAAPIFPYSPKLRVWDRSFLLSTLSSVLEQIDYESVRVVAFNLDQQKEIFRDHLSGTAGFRKLNQAMQDLELGKVSYQILQRREGATELLTQLVAGEKNDPNASDLVILLGPHTRYTEKITVHLLQPASPSTARNPQFFYLEYMPAWLRGSEFADNVEQVTKALGGKSFKIYSPSDLASAIQKIVAQVRTPARSAD
ncbi:MAG TPA: hypothetical protein VG498_20385 [Terriglobales bacterium]|nr:hypothetical protein [Terriglobales bacterium]